MRGKGGVLPARGRSPAVPHPNRTKIAWRE
jgi:hypothetical protein